MTRYICLHGHFYQPPRENPWLDVVDEQPSAAPYRDWNRRITAESYRPNAAARVLTEGGQIGRIVNNYGAMSFNIGPTLLAWMERAEPLTYEAIVRGDRESTARFGGHGSALAMPYNHMIMPLANDRDIRTQVRWGFRDFESRFGRRPRGMWLPETAVDLRTLEALAHEGIEFTVLAPWQAGRVRAPGGEWTVPTAEAGVDPKRPYRQTLPSGKSLTLFFYDGPVSAAVAFEQLLADGEHLAHRLESAFDADRTEDQLVHIATDGETFGHHHTHGEMALAYALDRFENDPDVRLTNYAEYLATHPPEWDVEIAEDTAWSCAHGVERWRSDCGFCTGARPEWSQAWRGPLREALNELRDEISAGFAASRDLFDDPWEARDAFIDIILDDSPQTRRTFLERHAPRAASLADRQRTWRLLEGQRHAMLMFTSCGWFFDDLDGIEVRQILRYAGRALELTGTPDMRVRFIDRLDEVRGNREESGTGRDIFEDEIARSKVTATRIAAWWAAASSVAGAAPNRPVFPAWHVTETSRREDAVDGVRLVSGRIAVESRSLEERDLFDFAALVRFAGDLQGGVRRLEDDARAPEHLLEVLQSDGVGAALAVLARDYSLEPINLETLARLRRSQPDHTGEALAAYAEWSLVSLADRWTATGEASTLDLAESMLTVAEGLPVTLDLWAAQNAWFRAVRGAGDQVSAGDAERLAGILERIGVSPDVVTPPDR